MLDLIQVIGLMPFISKPMFEYVENANSNLWVNKTVYGVVGVFDFIGDAEPGVYLNQTFLNVSSNVTVFYGLIVTKPVFDFKEDCKTRRFLYSVSYSLENDRVLDSKNYFLNLDFNDFENFSLDKKIIVPISIVNSTNLTFYFNAEAIFKIEHWHLTPHVYCSKEGCSTYYSCDYVGATYSDFKNSTLSSKEFYVLNESSSVTYKFDWYYGVRELEVEIKGDYLNFVLESNNKSVYYYSVEYPVFVDENNFSHVTLNPTSVYFERGVKILRKSIGNNTYNFSFLNIGRTVTLTLEFPFESKTFQFSDNQINTSVELLIPFFESPGNIVRGAVNLTSEGVPLNGSVLVGIGGKKLVVSAVNGIGFFSFEMPNSSVLVSASFERNGFSSSSDEKMIIVKTGYSSEIIFLFSIFLVLGYVFSLISGVKSKTLLKFSSFFIFILIIFFILSNAGWPS